MFIKNIIMSNSNPIAIKYHSYKVEFALRGAGHIHGVLWVDWEKFNALPKEDVKNITDGLEKIKKDEKISEPQKNSIADLAEISCPLKDPITEEIVSLVNMHHRTKTCRK